jgi:hypothetical protein
MVSAVTRALQAIKRYNATPDQIDHVVLSAINVTLCLACRGDDRILDGFNRDIVVNGRDFLGPMPQQQAA